MLHGLVHGSVGFFGNTKIFEGWDGCYSCGCLQWHWNAVSFAGSGSSEAVQEQGLAACSAVPERETPNAILWLVILVGA